MHIYPWGTWGYRSKGACDIERFKSTVVIEAEKAEEKLMSSWYPKVITLFSDSKLLPKLPKDRMDSFFECSSTLIGNQVGNAKLITIRYNYFCRLSIFLLLVSRLTKNYLIVTMF